MVGVGFLSLSACGGGGGGAQADPISGSPPPTSSPSPSPSPAPSPSPTPSPAPSPAPTPSPSPPPTAVVWVGPASTAPQGASVRASLQSVPWATLPAGALILVGPGEQAGPITISSQGTAAQPVEVRAADASNPPVVTSSIDFQGAAHVKLKGFVVSGSPWGAVVIRRGSHHITIEGNTLKKSYMGVNISDGAGEGLQVIDNLIEDNETHGIAIAMENTAQAATSRLAGNTIRRNGHHGVEVQSSYYVIERNVVSENGRGIGGASGIHLFSRNAAENSGDHNIIRYNFSFNNVDQLLHWDGNGIQVDQWCDSNLVAYNVAWGNDGAGLILFDTINNVAHNNTLVGNAQDSGRTASATGDLILSSSAAGSYRNANNRVYNNLIVARRSGAAGLTIDHATAANANQFGPNLWAPHPEGSAVVRKGNATARSASEVDSLLGSSGNAVETLSFSDPSAPLNHGLALTRPPSRSGTTPSDNDLLGTAPQAGYSFFGAYYTAP
ncbi:MAG: right-handed parallel beta-helix repeat-containing protein [Ideonella sp. MAG2]|nr:MAG: right-handed parallel beta-helix repeat-containing protein [Ideonella sp. MAG2]